jgi:hypothetical protein
MDLELNKYIAIELPWTEPINDWYDLIYIIGTMTLEDGKKTSTATPNTSRNGMQLAWVSDEGQTDTVLIQKEGDKIFTFINGEKDEGCTEEEMCQIFYNVIISFIINKKKGIVA